MQTMSVSHKLVINLFSIIPIDEQIVLLLPPAVSLIIYDPSNFQDFFFTFLECFYTLFKTVA